MVGRYVLQGIKLWRLGLIKKTQGLEFGLKDGMET